MRATGVSLKGTCVLCVFAFALFLAACGGGGGGGSAAPTPAPTGPVLPLDLLAGDMGGIGNADGVVAVARFTNPIGVATDSAGNVYVADVANSTIRKITPAGVASTFAGTAGVIGSTDATGAAASFNFPQAVATDGASNVYVADTANHSIRKITPAGVVSTLAGTAGVIGSTDATGPAASFNFPSGIATDGAGNVYVADASNHTIRKIVIATGVVTTLAGTAGVSGFADATGLMASFNFPQGIATDSVGNIYVADTGNNTIRTITPAGGVSTLAGMVGSSGSFDATRILASFNGPLGIATDSMGNVYVADSNNNTIRKITSAGVVSTLAGTASASPGSTDATGTAARFNGPQGVATDSAGNVYVADTNNNTIRKITLAGVVSTFAGTAGVPPGSTNAAGAAARFEFPTGVATDSAGNVYVADTTNHTIRKITPLGVVTTFAGTAGVSGITDSTGGTPSFNSPQAVATDSAGNVYVADTGNHSIRMITPAGAVSTLAGTAGVPGSFNATGILARFNSPQGVATDSAGNVYVADTGNHTIRKIVIATGVVTTLAGTAGTPGFADATGVLASFDHPSGIATDSTGNVFVADTYNNTIRKITAGVVTTFAGTAGLPGSANGSGATARFNFPQAIAIDSTNNIYVADTGNHTIRKITPAGAVSTVVGVAGQAGFAPGALPGLLANPQGVAVSGISLYITLYNGVAAVPKRP
jgi:sugar lactone lactonase YvrE